MLWKYKKCYSESNDDIVSLCVQDCVYMLSFTLVNSIENLNGISFAYKKCGINVPITGTLNIGETHDIRSCVQMGSFKINGNTIGGADVCFTQTEIDDALIGNGVISKSISDFTQEPSILVGQVDFLINDNICTP